MNAPLPLLTEPTVSVGVPLLLVMTPAAAGANEVFRHSG